MTSSIPLPFSRRTVASSAVFPCIFIASPMQGAPLILRAGAFNDTTASMLAALQLVYSQLTQIYPVLIHQDTANNAADLTAAIASATLTVQTLNEILAVMTATGDSAFVLANMQEVAASSLASLQHASVINE